MKFQKVRFIIYIVVLWGFFNLNTGTFAATLYVGAGEAYQTIQSAINAANHGDTVIVKNGDYKENIVINKQLILKSLNGYQTTFIGIDNWEEDVIKITSDNVTVQGFTIFGAHRGRKSESFGVGLYSVKNCIISDNRVGYDEKHNNTTGIFLSWSDSNRIIGNISNNVKKSSSIGILLSYSNNNEISGNTCSYNEEIGIYVEENSNKNSFVNNICSYNRNSGIKIWKANENDFWGNTCNSNNYGIAMDRASLNMISNNLCEKNNKTGIVIRGDCTLNIVEGNTCKENMESGIHHRRNRLRFSETEIHNDLGKRLKISITKIKMC